MANVVREHGGDARTLRLSGQEVSLTTAAIARMNLFLHDIEDFRIRRGDTLRDPKFKTADGQLDCIAVRRALDVVPPCRERCCQCCRRRFFRAGDGIDTVRRRRRNKPEEAARELAVDKFKVQRDDSTLLVPEPLLGPAAGEECCGHDEQCGGARHEGRT